MKMHDGDFITGQHDDFDPYVREQKRCACGNLMARTSGLETCQRCVDKKWAMRDQNDPKHRRGNKHGSTGVVQHGDRFASQICRDGVRKHLGTFSTAAAAATRYKQEAEVLDRSVTQ